MDPPLTIKQHADVKRALYLVDEEAVKVGAMFGLAAKHHAIDDLRTIGKLALYDSVRRFDEARKVKLAGFARLRVRGAMIDTVKAERKEARLLRGMARAVAYGMADYFDDFDVLRDDDAELQRRLDLFCDTADAIMFMAGAEETRRQADDDGTAGREEYAWTFSALAEVVQGIDPDGRALLDMVFATGFNLQQAADDLGVDRQTAWRRLRRLLGDMRRLLNTRCVREAPAPRNDVPIPEVLQERAKPT